MNAWRFNSGVHTLVLFAICYHFKLAYKDVFKFIKEFDYTNNAIISKDGKKYKITFEEIK